MPATWTAFPDCIGPPLGIEASVDQLYGDASALDDRSPLDNDLRRHPTLACYGHIARGVSGHRAQRPPAHDKLRK